MAPGLAKAMLSAMLRENRKMSCSILPMPERRACRLQVRNWSADSHHEAAVATTVRTAPSWLYQVGSGAMRRPE